MPTNGKMSERELQSAIVRAARTFGWRDAWTWRSIHSPKGWPDLVLARGLDLIIAELKAEKGKTTPEQDAWLDWWRNFGAAVDSGRDVYVAPDRRATVRVFVWRPADLEAAYAVLMAAPARPR